MKVKDDFAGRRALCPFCKAEVQVPEREQPREANEYPLAADDRDTRNDHDDRDDRPRRRARLRDDDEFEVRKKRSGGGMASGSVLTGVLMMVGALVWFFGALALGTIFFYPPILFIVGLVTFIKGLSGNSE